MPTSPVQTVPVRPPGPVSDVQVGGPAHRRHVPGHVPRHCARRARTARPGAVLAVVLVATLAINVETTVVNIALPTLNAALRSSTSQLQWIVDAYNLAFAALVLAGGTVGDRFGRRGTLITGLLAFAASSVAASWAPTGAALIVARFAMGASSALIYPTTLAIITATFREARPRAAAIGLWGATSGLGVAVGPVLGGALLRWFWWGSLFLALAPLALLAAAAAWLIIPRSHHSPGARLDRGGLLLSVVVLAALVYTLIEAPGRGWTSLPTCGGLVLAGLALVAFVRFEARSSAPLIDVSLFTNLRFSAASGAVTVAFFALFGFIFLITQFMQELQTLDPLSTGVRILPVAVSIAVGSVAGTRMAHTPLGTKGVVTAGLVLLAAAFAWATTVQPGTPYLVVAGQMVLLGGGLGLTSAPATDSVMGVVRPDQAGAGSAVNDATRQVGGTLGVAVLGSIYASLYSHDLDRAPALAHLPAQVRATAGEGLAQGLRVAGRTPPAIRAAVHDAVREGFVHGLHAGCATAAAVCLAGAVATAVLLPRHPQTPGAPR